MIIDKKFPGKQSAKCENNGLLESLKVTLSMFLGLKYYLRGVFRTLSNIYDGAFCESFHDRCLV